MFSIKKAAMALLLTVGTVFATAPAMAAIDITISNLGDFDLAAFSFDVNYDDSLLTFVDYTLTEELGVIDDWNASDWSEGDDGAGTIKFDVLSYLEDFSGQSDDFVLVSIDFSGIESALAGISLSNVDLSDAYGDPIPFTVDGTNISVVPVPGAFWLLGTCLVGLVGLRKRNR
jgi:hypothetical protein